jgi:hypothetical protein
LTHKWKGWLDWMNKESQFYPWIQNIRSHVTPDSCATGQLGTLSQHLCAMCVAYFLHPSLLTEASLAETPPHSSRYLQNC